MPIALAPELLKRALELQAKCWTHAQIAQELGVARETITRRLGKINRRALTRLEGQAAGIKARQVVQLERMAAEAVRGWERSRQEARTVKTIAVGDNGRILKTITTTKNQTGNPAYLAEARAALAEVRKVLGIDSKTDDMQAIPIREVEKLLWRIVELTDPTHHSALLSAVETLLAQHRSGARSKG